MTSTRIDPLTPPGTVVVCCHHEVLIEVLTAPAGERSDYIDRYKPEHERAVRHNAFRVLTTWEQLPAPVLDAGRAYADAWRAYDDARRAYSDAWRAYDDARRAYSDAWRACADAGRAYSDAWWAYEDAGRARDVALRAHWGEVVAVVRAEHPDLPVNWETGHLIFPSRPEEVDNG